MPEKKKVGIWIRVSTDFQVQSDSPEHHEERARSYAIAKGWEIITIYRLEAISGKSVMELTETKRMMADIKSKRITGLIFSKLARLARNTRELLDFSDFFRANNADLISIAESFDTSTAAGRLFYTMAAMFAEFERAEIAERVAASVPIRAKLGKPLGGAASYGYKWDKNQLVVDEKEAPVRKLIYELYLEHRRRNTVAKELNGRGYRTRKGSKWSDNSIERLLRDPTAKGIRRANYTKSRGDGKGWDLKPQAEWVETPCPAIVSVDLWNQCNAILNDQAMPKRRAGKKTEFLLAGFVYCSCGKKMYVFRNSYLCRDCKRRILVEDLDEIFQLQLQGYLTETSAKQLREESEAALADKERLLSMARQEHETLFKSAKDTVDLHLRGDLAKEMFLTLYKPLEERILQLEKHIPELEGEIDFLTINLASAETVIEEAHTLYEQWQTVAFEQKRAMIEIITESIVIENQDITISLASLGRQSTFLQNRLNNRTNLKGSYSQST